MRILWSLGKRFLLAFPSLQGKSRTRHMAIASRGAALSFGPAVLASWLTVTDAGTLHTIQTSRPHARGSGIPALRKESRKHTFQNGASWVRSWRPHERFIQIQPKVSQNFVLQSNQVGMGFSLDSIL